MFIQVDSTGVRSLPGDASHAPSRCVVQGYMDRESSSIIGVSNLQSHKFKSGYSLQ